MFEENDDVGGVLVVVVMVGDGGGSSLDVVNWILRCSKLTLEETQVILLPPPPPPPPLPPHAHTHLLPVIPALPKVKMLF